MVIKYWCRKCDRELDHLSVIEARYHIRRGTLKKSTCLRYCSKCEGQVWIDKDGFEVMDDHIERRKLTHNEVVDK